MAAMENDFENTTISLYGTVPDSIVDGPGLRYAVFVQGCTHGCPGCHNPESQPRAGGEVRAIDDLVAHIAANKLAQGVTISGRYSGQRPRARRHPFRWRALRTAEGLRSLGCRAEAQWLRSLELFRLPL